jgi:phosphate starvation-inducible protein PhoH and related proteins
MFTLSFGRAQPLYSKLLTPRGWITMSEVKIGDEVISLDGKPTKVIGVFPQGEKEIYRVHLSDGSFTDCCGDHLWKTWTYRERGYNQRGRKLGKDWECGRGQLRTLHEIMNSLRSTHLNAKNHSIPMVEKIQFEKRDVKLDPYTLGVILGDGNISKDHIMFFFLSV